MFKKYERFNSFEVIHDPKALIFLLITERCKSTQIKTNSNYEISVFDFIVDGLFYNNILALPWTAICEKNPYGRR